MLCFHTTLTTGLLFLGLEGINNSRIQSRLCVCMTRDICMELLCSFS